MLETRANAYASSRQISRAAIMAVAIAAAAIAGCGGDDEFANQAREPAQITLSASIGRRDITVSPARIGAGPVELLASNQTPVSQVLTLRSTSRAASSEPLQQRTGPINPGDTASLTADLAAGTYALTTRSRERESATIRVGPARLAGTDRLLQP
jgi:hypothetical protein